MSKLPVRYYHLAKIGVDASLLVLAFAGAYVARFEGVLTSSQFEIFWMSLPLVLGVKLLALHLTGVPNLAWRCAGWMEIGRIVQGVLLGSAILAVLRGASPYLESTVLFSRYLAIPYGVLLIDAALATIALIGVRGMWRRYTENKERRNLSRMVQKPALIVGTGPNSIQIARELRSRPQLGIDVMGLLAEDPQKVGMQMSGVPVVGWMQTLPELVDKYNLDLVLIPMPEDGKTIRDIAARCEECGVTARVIAEGSEREEKLNWARIRQVTVEDLLRRPPVRLSGDAVAGLIQAKTVLVTGAGGSIGSQLCREICKHKPGRLILLEQAENNLFNIHRNLMMEFPDVTLTPAVADVCDQARLEQLFLQYKPDVIFHAAAHKHVPMMEWNVTEAVKNNVLGTQGLADMAHQFGVGYFVMVSTDKAVRPTSVMGVSKRVAELYVQALAQQSKTRFVTVRFGNVLGSAGSVIPIFQEQIAAGGPVTVTHKDMQRYFMTIPEACQLILEAGSLGQGGEIFVLDMGQPVKIVDLARDMIRLSGFQPDTDIEIRFSGIRPGEKLFEELSLDEEQTEKTRHPRIFIGKKEEHDLDGIRRQIHELAELVPANDGLQMRGKFKEIVPEYTYKTGLTPVPSSLETVSAMKVKDDTPLQIQTIKSTREGEKDPRPQSLTS